MKKVAVILQARTKSSRLPNKVLADLGGITLIEFLIQRLFKAEIIKSIILATTIDQSDDVLIKLAKKLNCLM